MCKEPHARPVPMHNNDNQTYLHKEDVSKAAMAQCLSTVMIQCSDGSGAKLIYLISPSNKFATIAQKHKGSFRELSATCHLFSQRVSTENKMAVAQGLLVPAIHCRLYCTYLSNKYLQRREDGLLMIMANIKTPCKTELERFVKNTYQKGW